MNKREKYVWDQMQTFLKTSYKDPEAQQYIHSAQVRHTTLDVEYQRGFSVTAENDSEHDSPACGTLRCPERGWTSCIWIFISVFGMTLGTGGKLCDFVMYRKN